MAVWLTVCLMNHPAFGFEMTDDTKGTAASCFVAHTAVQNAFEGGAKTVRTKLVLDDGSTMNEWFAEETYQFRLGRIFSFQP